MEAIEKVRILARPEQANQRLPGSKELELVVSLRLVSLGRPDFENNVARAPEIPSGVLAEWIGSGVLVGHITGEGHQHSDRITAVLDVLGDRDLPAHRLQPAARLIAYLVEKKWYCSDVCGKCGAPTDEQTGRCRLQGVKPQSVWQRFS